MSGAQIPIPLWFLLCPTIDRLCSSPRTVCRPRPRHISKRLLVARERPHKCLELGLDAHQARSANHQVSSPL